MPLYISDLDGTLLRDNASLSDYARTSLSRMLHAGLPFTVASARSIVAIRSILEGLPLRLPVVEFNGAFISDFATGAHRCIHSYDRDLAYIHTASLLLERYPKI